jgi:3-deoxy-D-manno-octulosonic-acid transferase
MAPFILLWRLKKGKEDPERINERRGKTTHPRPKGSLIWIHATSVGEVRSVLPLMERLTQQGYSILLTSTTRTSAELVKKHQAQGIYHQFVPLDIPRYVRRFLHHWRPDIALFAESELWPALILEIHQQRIPFIIVNGRLSLRSFHRWKILPTTMRILLSRVNACLMQTQEDAERWTNLGGKNVNVIGNLKYDVPPPTVDPKRLARQMEAIRGRPTWIAASTHKGEEEGLIDVHAKLHAQFPNLLTCVVPRHPERAAELVERARQKGFESITFSQDRVPTLATSLYIGDTIGDLGLFYRLSSLVFMGGSLTNHGGQNPLEPIQLGNFVLHGPYVFNFREMYEALDQCKGTLPVASFETLAATVAQYLRTPETVHSHIKAGQHHIHCHHGALDRTVKAIETWLPPTSELKTPHASLQSRCYSQGAHTDFQRG